ncbi:MAG: hypothetical protein KF836_02955 [Fimbriimonadaceae bacterium]|nr:hypothetical protein [Fimbriimonadaceae bacterium]
MMGERPQKLILGLVIGGFVLTIGAAILFVILTVLSSANQFPEQLGVVIPVVIFIAGVLCFAIAVGAGWKNVGFKDSSQPIAVEPNSYIVACFIVDKKNEPVYEPDMFEPDEITYIVQIAFRNGDKHELTTSPEVFATLGEGLVGKVHFQGRKLLNFERDLTAKHERKR